MIGGELIFVPSGDIEHAKVFEQVRWFLEKFFAVYFIRVEIFHDELVFSVPGCYIKEAIIRIDGKGEPFFQTKGMERFLLSESTKNLNRKELTEMFQKPFV